MIIVGGILVFGALIGLMVYGLLKDGQGGSGPGAPREAAGTRDGFAGLPRQNIGPLRVRAAGQNLRPDPDEPDWSIKQIDNHGLVLDIKYVNSGGKETIRRVRVDGAYGPSIRELDYIRARDSLSGEDRTFRLDRILTVAIPEKAVINEDPGWLIAADACLRVGINPPLRPEEIEKQKEATRRRAQGIGVPDCELQIAWIRRDDAPPEIYHVIQIVVYDSPYGRKLSGLARREKTGTVRAWTGDKTFLARQITEMMDAATGEILDPDKWISEALEIRTPN